MCYFQSFKQKINSCISGKYKKSPAVRGERLKFEGGAVAVPTESDLGVELDRKRIGSFAPKLYKL
jgi:L-alanine-DL-glutamate epimerase-like enolase superfamily enzyme